jgi:hypothetical protein
MPHWLLSELRQVLDGETTMGESDAPGLIDEDAIAIRTSVAQAPARPLQRLAIDRSAHARESAHRVSRSLLLQSIASS